MKYFDKGLIEERIRSSVESSKVIHYCVGDSYGLLGCFVGLIIPSALAGIFVNPGYGIFAGFIVIASIVYFFITYRKYIVVFLTENLLLIKVKGEELKIIDTDFYKYQEIKGITVGEKEVKFQFRDRLPVNINPSTDNSSFLLKDFDAKQFITDKKSEEEEFNYNKKSKDRSETVDHFLTKEETEEKKARIFEERLKKKLQIIADSLLVEKDKGLITNEEFLKEQNEILGTCKSELTEQDDHILYDVYLKLAETKQATVERLLETIKKDELMVYHYHKIKLITKEMWEKIVSEGLSGNYEIIMNYSS